jgi:hypothetical protein
VYVHCLVLDEHVSPCAACNVSHASRVDPGKGAPKIATAPPKKSLLEEIQEQVRPMHLHAHAQPAF